MLPRYGCTPLGDLCPAAVKNDSWSISLHSFPLGAPAHACSTVAQLLDAVKYGRRVWDGATTEQTGLSRAALEALPSRFSPKRCAIPFFTPARACAAFARFSRVLLLGDSLHRHLLQAIMIALGADLGKSGLLVSQRWQTEHPKEANALRRKCQCDGQFSEAMVH